MAEDPSTTLELPEQIPFAFPLNGINQHWSRANQPAGTTPDCLNVMPYDIGGRARGGQRPGFSQISSNQYGAASNTARAQLLLPLTTEVAGSRKDYLVLVAGGRVYYGTALATLAQITTTAAATRATVVPYWLGTHSYSTSSVAMQVDGYPVMSGATLNGIAYIVDGKSTNGFGIDFTVVPPVWATPLTAHGIAPWSNQASIAVTYRKRLILSGCVQADPQNFYASRIGDPTDWDYSKPDPAGAFAGNASKAGQIGDPITALIPFGDDAMLIGCDRSIWLMNGDIKAGGRIDVISRVCGVLSQTAWCFDPNGNLYFIGTTGLFRMRRGLYQLENLSDTAYNDYFVALTSGKRVVNLVWDRDRHGLWIFNTPDPVGTTNHLWWDERQAGFFPQQFPNAMGPTAAMMWSPAGGGQTLIMGGYSGAGTGALLFKLDPTVSTDNGATVNAYIWCGPVRPASIYQEMLLESCQFTMGELPGSFTGTFNVTATLQAGVSAYDAFATSTRTTSSTFTTGGRQALQRNRLRGESFMLKLANNTSNTTFSVEESVGAFRVMGRVRA